MHVVYSQVSTAVKRYIFFYDVVKIRKIIVNVCKTGSWLSRIIELSNKDLSPAIFFIAL